MTQGILEALAQRRSVRPTMFSQSGPTGEELQTILQIAARVPDHKKLSPWRFIVFEGAARERAGELFSQACQDEHADDASPARLEVERGRFLRAPVVVALITSFVDKPAVPQWEQTLSTGAVGMNLCHAANAMGYATCWLTEWIAYSECVRQGLSLADNERVAGFIYLGRPTQTQEDRDRPALDQIVSRF